MADEKPKTVKVKALQEHTAFGKAYKVGDTYEIPETHLESIIAQGKAAPVAPAAPAPPQK